MRINDLLKILDEKIAFFNGIEELSNRQIEDIEYLQKLVAAFKENAFYLYTISDENLDGIEKIISMDDKQIDDVRKGYITIVNGICY